MDFTTQQAILLVGGALAGYVVVMLANPARASLCNGLRCLTRYQRIWLIPAAFALTHAGLEFCLHLHAATDTPKLFAGSTLSTEAAVVGWFDVLNASCLSAAESTSALFNCVVTAFPISVVGALLFLCNWRRVQSVIWRGLLRRCGTVPGFFAHLFIVLCALAALCKPLAFYLLSGTHLYFDEATTLRGGELINTFSSFFEYLLGVGAQIYLLLLAFVWARGLTFNFSELRHLAFRRFTVVARWAAVILVISGVGINLPLVLASFYPQASVRTMLDYGLLTRWLLAGVLLLFCAAQVLLTVHNHSLKSAATESFRLWRLHGWQVGWLIIVAALHFSLLAIVNTIVPHVFGPWSWLTGTWNLLACPILWSALAGWFLAAWVCLFRRCEGQRLEVVGLV